ncbi:MAG TPA: LLM class F420-dependent oxidoreductase [Acidimicrobiia bacterium]|nr:LLM class F420-dependent oxidoreductase [Acidimicrobiia bacterium]
MTPPVTRLGLQIPNFTFPGVADADLFETIAGIATTAEGHGFDSVWVMDHLYQIEMVGPREDPMLEAYSLLSALAARTGRVGLGTMVTGVTYRNPALLAKIVTTLDVISSGRAILGIGAAWNDDEHAGYGFDFPSVKERMDRLEEALQIIRAMFTETAPTFEGRYYKVREVLNNPKPIRGRIPILIGGSGEKRTLRLVAQYGDACNLFGDPDTVRHKLDVLERHCADVGRDPAEITKTALQSVIVRPTAAEAEKALEAFATSRGTIPDRARPFLIAGDPETVSERIAAYRAAGIDGMVVNMPEVADLDAVALAGETLSQALA